MGKSFDLTPQTIRGRMSECRATGAPAILAAAAEMVAFFFVPAFRVVIGQGLGMVGIRIGPKMDCIPM